MGLDLVRATTSSIGLSPGLHRRAGATMPTGAGMSLGDFDAVLDMIAGGGQPSYTGKLVSPKSALSISAVWACVSVLSDDFATLPLPVYRRIIPGESREEARDHYLWPLLNESANPRMSSNRFQAVMELWRQLWGNTYAEIETNGRGQITALWPWRPDRVKVWPSDPSDPRSRINYTYIPLDRRKPLITVSEDHILHIRNTSLDGITGLSPIEVHRQTLGTSMAMTEHEGRFYSNGAVIKGVLTHPSKLGPKAEQSLRESLRQYIGLSNSHRMMILEEGMEYKEIGMKMGDAQFVESMNLSINDIARIFKVPAHRINQLDKATNNNIEQLAMEYVQYTLGPNATRWTAEIHHSCLSAREQDSNTPGSVFVGPDYSYLLAADSAARAQFYVALANTGAFAPDNIRHKEGLNPLPGGIGKIPRVNQASIPLGSELASGKRAPTPSPSPSPTSSPAPSPAPEKKPAEPSNPPKKKKKKALAWVEIDDDTEFVEVDETAAETQEVGILTAV